MVFYIGLALFALVLVLMIFSCVFIIWLMYYSGRSDSSSSKDRAMAPVSGAHRASSAEHSTNQLVLSNIQQVKLLQDTDPAFAASASGKPESNGDLVDKNLVPIIKDDSLTNGTNEMVIDGDEEEEHSFNTKSLFSKQTPNEARSSLVSEESTETSSQLTRSTNH